VARLHLILQAALPPPLQVIEAPVDWVLRRAPLPVRQPDLAVIDPREVAGPHLTDPPVLAVEVLSPTSRERDLITKRAQYATAGLDWFWLVDLDRPQILVLRRKGELFSAHARAEGRDVLSVVEPFAVEVRPADLLVG
jgi:Uma2 family endonuclease